MDFGEESGASRIKVWIYKNKVQNGPSKNQVADNYKSCPMYTFHWKMLLQWQNGDIGISSTIIQQ